MTDEQYALIQRLSRCRFRDAPHRPGSAEKRFARDMASAGKEYELSERQVWYLAFLRYRYRKQLHEPDAPKPPEPPARQTTQSGPCIGRTVRTASSRERDARNEQIRLEQWNTGKPRTE